MIAQEKSALRLPEVKLFRQHSTHLNGWSDHYGALQVAAAYAGVTLPERYFIKAIWMHGCAGPWQQVVPGTLYANSPAGKNWPLYVGRQDEADCLRAHGCASVRAIGLPIAYAPSLGVTRQPGSLLVMPTHTLIGDGCDDRSAFERYADEIKAVAGQFERVVVCIHPNCQKNGLWVNEFSSRGFEIVYGAQTDDVNALTRMRALFEQFETVTTNGWGGHVAYALAFGARVAIDGTQPTRRESDLLRDECWSADQNALRAMLSSEMESNRRTWLNDFYCAPVEAKADVARGQWLIGTEHRLTPAAMATELAAMLDLPGVAKPTASATSSAAKRRILFVSHEATRTGAPMFLLHLLRWLRREAKVDFEILLGAGGPLEEEFRKVGLVHFKKDLENDPAALARFDLIYANTCLNGELLDELPCAGIPIITHVHELDSAYDQLGARRLGVCLRQTSWVQAGSEAVAACLEKRFGWARERMSVCPKLVDVAAFEKRPAADWATARRQYGLSEDAQVIVGCGPQHWRKGIDLFLQLALLVKTRLGAGRPVRFLWIGAEARPELAAMLAADIRQMGLQADVTLLGELADPRPVLALADAVCLPSREDAGPFAMLEAAALGKPLLGFEAAGGLAEFARHGGGIMVPHLDVPALADACVAVLSDELRRAEMGGAARLLVEEQFAVAVRGPEILGRVAQMGKQSGGAKPRPSLAEIYARWCLEEAPQRPYVLAHLARSRARREAADLIKVGQHKEAMGALVRALNADLATNSPLVICESLCDIGQDIAPFDAKQATVLFDRAAQVARGAQLSIEGFRPKQFSTNPASLKSPVPTA